MNEEVIYADVIGDLAVSGGVVRLALYTEYPPPLSADGTQPPSEFRVRHRLVIPLSGLIQALPLFDSFRRQLESQGFPIDALKEALIEPSGAVPDKGA
ncbi:MAG: hypothetical protein LBK01_00570 [Burkholderiaceae bacterium]|jgi:hypothetical protein|nr:hypothetical protein [Burkholderiaceae bacterium]